MDVVYETLTCEVCGKEFFGRKPSEDGPILCPDDSVDTPVINEGEEIPETVDEEMAGGRGDDE